MCSCYRFAWYGKTFIHTSTKEENGNGSCWEGKRISFFQWNARFSSRMKSKHAYKKERKAQKFGANYKKVF